MSGSANFHAKVSPSGLERTMACHASVHLTEKFYDDVVVDSLRNYKTLIPYLVKEVPSDEWSKQERKVIPLVRGIFKKAAEFQGTPKEQTVWHDEIAKLDRTTKKMIEQNAGSVAAREGTRAHDFAEKILNGDMKPEDLPEAFYDGVMMYVDFCRDLHDKDPDDVAKVELVIPIFYDRQSSCTSDFVKILGNRDKIHVVDLKYGKGKFVKAERNPQLATYACSTLNHLEAEDEFALHNGTMVEMVIVQPRNHEGEGYIRKWEVSYRDLKAFCKEIQTEVKQIFAGSMKYGPSEDVCRWCPVRNRCSESYFKTFEGIPGGRRKANEFFEKLPDYTEHAKSIEKYKAIPPSQRAEIQGFNQMEIDDLVALWKSRKALVRMAEDLDDYLTFLVEGGLKHPELKLVEGRAPNPHVGDEEGFAAFLLDQGFSEEDIYESKFVGITKARKLMGDTIKPLVKNKTAGIYKEELAKEFDSFLHRNPGTPSLALFSDKRKEVKKKVDYFQNLDQIDPDSGGDPLPPQDIT